MLSSSLAASTSSSSSGAGPGNGIRSIVSQAKFNGLTPEGEPCIDPHSVPYWFFLDMEHLIREPVTFHQFASFSEKPAALISKRGLEIFCGITHAMGMYPFVYDTATAFDFCVSTISLIPSEDMQTLVGMLFQTIVAKPHSVSNGVDGDDEEEGSEGADGSIAASIRRSNSNAAAGGGGGGSNEVKGDEKKSRAAEARAEKAKQLKTEKKQARDPGYLLHNNLKRRSRLAYDSDVTGKSAHRRKQMGPTGNTFFHTMNVLEYVNLCKSYSPEPMPAVVGSFKISDPYTPFHPANVFSLTNALTLMERAGAHPDTLNVLTWMDRVHEYIATNTGEINYQYFLNGEQTFRVAPTEMDPKSIHLALLPHKMPPPLPKSHMGYLDALKRYGNNDERAREFIMEMCAGNTEHTLPAWRARSRERGKEFLTRPTIESQAKARRKFQKTALADLDNVLNEYGGLSTAQLAKVKHLDSIIQKKRWCLPNDPIFKNLTPFANLIIKSMLYHENLANVYVSHVQSLLGEFAVLLANSDEKMKLNLFFMGLTAAGKSELISRLIEKAIQGSIQELTGQSAKAFFDSTLNLDGVVLAFHEAPPSLICASGGGGGVTSGKTATGKDSAQTDTAAILRDLLTRGELNYARMERDPVTGRQKRYELKIQAMLTIILAMNVVTSDVPDNMADRMMMLLIAMFGRVDTALLDALTRTLSEKSEKQSEQYVERFRRNEAVIAYLDICQSGRCLAPVNETNSNAFIQSVLAIAEQHGNTTSQKSRYLKRVRMLVRLCCKLEAVWQWFDGPDAVMSNDLPWESQKDRLMDIDKLYIASIEHAVFALTISIDQVEDPVMLAVMKAVNIKIRYLSRPGENDIMSAPGGGNDGDGNEETKAPARSSSGLLHGRGGAQSDRNLITSSFVSLSSSSSSSSSSTSSSSSSRAPAKKPIAPFHGGSQIDFEGYVENDMLEQYVWRPYSERTGKGRSYQEHVFDTASRVRTLATMIHCDQLDRFAQKEVFRVLMQLTQQEAVITQEDGTRTALPVLRWVHEPTATKIQFNRSFWGYGHEVESVFCRAIQAALDQQGIQDLNYITGMPDEKDVYVLRIMTRTPDAQLLSTRKPFIIRNSSYVSPGLSRMMTLAMGPNGDEKKDDDDDEDEDVGDEVKATTSGKDTLVDALLRPIKSIPIYDSRKLYEFAHTTQLLMTRTTEKQQNKKISKSGKTLLEMMNHHLRDAMMTPGLSAIYEYPEDWIAIQRSDRADSLSVSSVDFVSKAKEILARRDPRTEDDDDDEEEEEEEEEKQHEEEEEKDEPTSNTIEGPGNDDGDGKEGKEEKRDDTLSLSPTRSPQPIRRRRQPVRIAEIDYPEPPSMPDLSSDGKRTTPSPPPPPPPSPRGPAPLSPPPPLDDDPSLIDDALAAQEEYMNQVSSSQLSSLSSSSQPRTPAPTPAPIRRLKPTATLKRSHTTSVLNSNNRAQLDNLNPSSRPLSSTYSLTPNEPPAKRYRSIQIRPVGHL